MEKSILYQKYAINELPVEFEKIIAHAKNATHNSYAPYSHFYVGAALLLDDDTILEGSNQENASYPIGLCAERIALAAKASLAPDKKIKAIAISVRKEEGFLKEACAPCGICRQSIFESENQQCQDIKVILYGEDEILIFKSIKDLLPFHFDASYL